MAFASKGSAMTFSKDKKGYGSPTNASDAIDAPEIGPEATAEEVLDVGIEYTFPASDPVSVESAYRMAGQKRPVSRS